MTFIGFSIQDGIRRIPFWNQGGDLPDVAAFSGRPGLARRLKWRPVMPERKEWTLQIGGMTCDHCARTIDAAFRRVPGVVSSETSFESGAARVVTEGSV